jgi:precorrin-6B methylase 2
VAWAVPPAIEDALYAAARAQLGDAPLATAQLTRAIVDRSERYTSDRAHLAVKSDGDLVARAVFWTIADAMKVCIPLAELLNRDALPARRPLRVVDLGAGCGAMSLGLSTMLRDIELVAIDRDAAALAIAKHALAQLGTSVTTQTGDVRKVTLPPCDLVVMGTVLNELAEAEARGVVERALAAVADDGAVIVVEPALRTTSRALHAIRDALIADGAHIFAPCTRRIAPCPMLADPDDWCHEDRALALPPRTAELARLTHLRDGGMKFSYLVVRKQPLALVDDPSAWRLVSAARIAKGKHEITGCSDRGRIPLRLLKRNRTAENKVLERADRGDVVIAREAPGDDRVEVAGPVTHIDTARR